MRHSNLFRPQGRKITAIHNCVDCGLDDKGHCFRSIVEQYRNFYRRTDTLANGALVTPGSSQFCRVTVSTPLQMAVQIYFLWNKSPDRRLIGGWILHYSVLRHGRPRQIVYLLLFYSNDSKCALAITSTQVMVYHWWIPCETLVHTGSR